MTRIRAFCFDLDGTLINSGPDIVHAANLTRRAYMVPELPYEQIIRYVGSGVQHLMRGVMQDLAEEEWDDAIQFFLNAYHSAMTVRTHLYDGILELLHSQRDTPMAVLTNKPEEFSAIILKYFNIDSCFQILIGAEARFPKKPDPQGLLHICRQLNCHPEDMAMIGDSVVDIETARAAGCQAIAVSWGFQAVEELMAAQPDRMIHHPRELM